MSNAISCFIELCSCSFVLLRELNFCVLHQHSQTARDIFLSERKSVSAVRENVVSAGFKIATQNILVPINQLMGSPRRARLCLS